jgi:hypothetical protein
MLFPLRWVTLNVGDMICRTKTKTKIAADQHKALARHHPSLLRASKWKHEGPCVSWYRGEVCDFEEVGVKPVDLGERLAQIRPYHLQQLSV